jgi:hypothetical protein
MIQYTFEAIYSLVLNFEWFRSTTRNTRKKEERLSFQKGPQIDDRCISTWRYANTNGSRFAPKATRVPATYVGRFWKSHFDLRRMNENQWTNYYSLLLTVGVGWYPPPHLFVAADLKTESSLLMNICTSIERRVRRYNASVFIASMKCIAALKACWHQTSNC